jgi:ABC-type bacteriocin/lantibiotic exporter with double-glycine peptidase domain
MLLFAIAVFRAGPIVGNILSALIQIGASVTDINQLSAFFKLLAQKNLTQGPIFRIGEYREEEEDNFNYSVSTSENSIILQFNNVSFKYKTSVEYTIKNLNFNVKKGEFLGIKGSSGSGKTTIINLICGLLQPTRGRITFPEPRSFNSYRTSGDVAIVEQNVVLFPSSLIFNITLKDRPSGSDIIRVKEILNKVGLGHLGSDVNLGELLGDAGRQVSGGQRQRIGLARALFSEAKIVVLDEFTSALDDDSENRCIEILENLRGQVTAIIVSHRNRPLLICNNMIELRS